MKKKKLIAVMSVIAMALTLSFNVLADCGVSSDASKNTGKCRADANGTDQCNTSGEGTTCAPSVNVDPPPMFQ